MSAKKQKKSTKKKIILFFIIGIIFVAAVLIYFRKADDKNSGDIVSQKKTEEGRIPITVMVKYAFTINSFEKAVEEKFPKIDLVQVGNYTRDMGIAEYERRLENDDLTDIVMTWPLEVGEEYWKDRLLDLSGHDFTSRYKLSFLNTISRDGSLYYLPGPSQVRGLVYNKTLFEENGWKVPNNYDEFLELCKKIEAKGIRPVQLGFQNEEVLDTAFIGYNYGNYYSKPEDIRWIARYNEGSGSFGDHFSGALDLFQQMVEEGIWKPSDLNVDYSEREVMLYNRKCAMVEDSVLMARMGSEWQGSDDEFGLMPFFNPGENNDWARLYMVCYIGLNKHLTDPGNEEKYELALELMDYISTPEGQKALIADTGAMFSSLNDTESPNVSEIEQLLPALNEGRYAIFNQLANAQSALREGLRGILTREMTKQEVIELVDEQNKNPVAAAVPEVIGNAEKDFTWVQTGSFIADTMREYSNTDIALFLDNGKDGKYNGKGLSGRLYQGEITESDLNCILPDLKDGDMGKLQKITMTGQELLDTLEYSIETNVSQGGWFYYFSGLKMKYDPVAEPGKRIQRIRTEQGKEINPTEVYSIAVMKGSVPDEAVIDRRDEDITIFELLKQTIREKHNIAPPEDNRFDFDGK